MSAFTKIMLLAISLLSVFMADAQQTSAEVVISYLQQSSCDGLLPQTGCNEIVSFNPASGLEAIVQAPPGSVEPSALLWSQDEDNISFLLSQNSVPNIYSLDTQDLTLRQITYLEDDAVTFISASPHDDRVAYSVVSPDNPNPNQLNIVDVETLEQTVLLDGYTVSGQAQWSPDGENILIAGAPSTQSSALAEQGIYSIDVHTEEVVRLTSDDVHGSAPVWSSSGQHIAFLTAEEQQNQIVVMDADGGEPVYLTSDDSRKARPEWVLEDTHILYVEYTPQTGVSQFVLLNVDDGSSEVLSTQQQFSGSSVSPNGDNLAYIAVDGTETQLCIYNLVDRGEICYPQTNPDPNSVPVWR